MREIDAIGKCAAALRGLGLDECERVLRYLDDRFVVHRSPRDAESLAPVVGAEGGENARTEPLPVGHETEPGPDGMDDGPARASMEGDR